VDAQHKGHGSEADVAAGGQAPGMQPDSFAAAEGTYVITAEAGLLMTQSETRHSRQLKKLPFGTEVEVTRVRRMEADDRIRGRMQLGSEVGWISLQETGTSKHFAQRRAAGNTQAWADQVLGTVLESKTGFQPTREVLKSASRVCLYFTSPGCMPCVGFTQMLAKAVTTQRDVQSELAIIYVPVDPDQFAIERYYRDMPWLKLPNWCTCGSKASECMIRGCPKNPFLKLSAEHSVRAIPHMVVLHGMTGQVVSTTARIQMQEKQFELRSCLRLWGAEEDTSPVPVGPGDFGFMARTSSERAGQCAKSGFTASTSQQRPAAAPQQQTPASTSQQRPPAASSPPR